MKALIRLWACLLLLAVASFVSAGRLKPWAVLDRFDDSQTNYAAAISPDGKALATGGLSRSLKLWDVARGKLIRDWTAEENEDVPSVRSLAFSPDGKTLAVAANGHFATQPSEVQLWGLTEKKPRLRLKGHTGSIGLVLYSADGKTVASTGSGGTVRLWDGASGKARGVLKVGGPVTSMAFSRDGKRLFCGTSDGGVDEWEVAAGRWLRTLPSRRSAVVSLALSADGAVLMSAQRNKVITLWDVKAGKVKQTIAETGAHAVLRADGKHVIWADGAGRIGVWRVGDREEVRRESAGITFPYALVLSPDGKTLAYITEKSRIQLWNADELVRSGK